MTADIDKIKIHFFYCILLLGLAIIAIATDRWTVQPNFTAYLSNAATMTSLVLGLVAIFYSFISNNNLSQSLGNINNVAENIVQIKNQISSYLSLTEKATEVTRTSTDQMQRLSEKVDKDLSSLTMTLNAISEKSELLHDSINALPSRLDRLESSVIDATKAVGEKIQPPSTPTESEMPTDSSVLRFLKLAPLFGNLLAIACVLANKHGKKLNLDEFSKAINENVTAYSAGFLACMDAAQLVDREIIKDEYRIYNIKSVHPRLNQSSRTYFSDYIERNYRDKPELLDKWKAKLIQIEAMFTSENTENRGV